MQSEELEVERLMQERGEAEAFRRLAVEEVKRTQAEVRVLRERLDRIAFPAKYNGGRSVDMVSHGWFAMEVARAALAPVKG